MVSLSKTISLVSPNSILLSNSEEIKQLLIFFCLLRTPMYCEEKKIIVISVKEAEPHGSSWRRGFF